MNQTTPELQSVKKLFMAYRNGILADSLRKAGMADYKIIFGLNLPQLSSIAQSYGRNNSLARALWEDSAVRESRLLAILLFDPATMSVSDALDMFKEVKTREEADIICFKLFRYIGDADKLLQRSQAIAEPTPLMEYTVKMLERNLQG